MKMNDSDKIKSFGFVMLIIGMASILYFVLAEPLIGQPGLFASLLEGIAPNATLLTSQLLALIPGCLLTTMGGMITFG